MSSFKILIQPPTFSCYCQKDNQMLDWFGRKLTWAGPQFGMPATSDADVWFASQNQKLGPPHPYGKQKGATTKTKIVVIQSPSDSASWAAIDHMGEGKGLEGRTRSDSETGFSSDTWKVTWGVCQKGLQSGQSQMAWRSVQPIFESGDGGENPSRTTTQFDLADKEGPDFWISRSFSDPWQENESLCGGSWPNTCWKPLNHDNTLWPIPDQDLNLVLKMLYIKQQWDWMRERLASRTFFPPQ